MSIKNLKSGGEKMIIYLPIKRGIKTIPLLILFLLVFHNSSFADQYRVTKVYDGETIKAKGHGAEIKIRLAGIDAPEICKSIRETGQPFSRKSKEYLAGLVLNKTVEIEGYGYQRYNEILGSIFLDGESVNLKMVRAGLAEVNRGNSPSDLEFEPFVKAENEARSAKKGIWIKGDKYVSSKVWRKMKRARSLFSMILYALCEQGVK